MPLFIKTEIFKPKALALVPQKKKHYINAHKSWVNHLRSQGLNISSGYLVDAQGKPGGGGLLVLESTDIETAKILIRQDPMIVAGLVTWEIQEWIPVIGSLI